MPRRPFAIFLQLDNSKSLGRKRTFDIYSDFRGARGKLKVLLRASQNVELNFDSAENVAIERRYEPHEKAGIHIFA